MRSTKILKTGLILLIGIVALGVALSRPFLLRPILQRLIHLNAEPFFADSIRIEKAAIDRNFRIHLRKITGAFQAREGPVPFEVKAMVSKDPVFFFVTGKPVRFVFEGIRPENSPRAGVSGECTIQPGRLWQMDCRADFKEVDLEDLQWLDPKDLQGATGRVKGKLAFQWKPDQDPVFDVALEAPEPGGLLQARFFDLFLPYLPKSVQKERVEKLISSQDRLVRYQDAVLEVSLPQSDHMKVLLRILVLDYNLKLTINVDIRMDAKNAFSQIAQLMGLIEVK